MSQTGYNRGSYVQGGGWLLVMAGVMIVLAVVAAAAFSRSSKRAAVLILFGGTKDGARQRVFLDQPPVSKDQDLAPRPQPHGDKLKVNDKRGNPIEIAAVVVWRVQDTAQACFDVDNYEHYIGCRASRQSAISPALCV